MLFFSNFHRPRVHSFDLFILGEQRPPAARVRGACGQRLKSSVHAKEPTSSERPVVNGLERRKQSGPPANMTTRDVEDVLPRDEEARRWLLSQGECTAHFMPWEGGRNMLIEMTSPNPSQPGAEVPNILRNADTILGKSVMLSALSTTDVGCMGTAWIISSSAEPVKKARYASESDRGLRRTVIAYVESGENLAFTNFVELDGRKTAVSEGLLYASDRSVQIRQSSVASRSCNNCIINAQLCVCESKELAQQFNEMLDSLRNRFRETANLQGVFGLQYIGRLLEGSRTLIMNEDIALCVDVSCSIEGDTFDRAAECILHHNLESSRSFNSRGSDSSTSVLCKTCGSAFRGKYEMQRHVKSVHERRRDHKCSNCTKSFSQRGHLNEHNRSVHQGDGEFSCAKCSKSFGAASKLERHMLTVHCNLRLHTCKVCKGRYKERCYLRQHMARMHPNEDANSSS
mmetsp:Transcript_8558/g.25721  ORF Transcript_8558/g.25721 Transcript_8558/m.25721 type:complete len:458 (+) Transcript_8558:1061-2434(+)